MRKLICGWVMLLLGACTFHKGPSQYEKLMFEESRKCGHFDKIGVQGPIDVELHTGYRHSKLEIKGAYQAQPYLETKVRHGKLMIRCIKKCAEYGPMKIQIKTRHLIDFKYQGRGQIRGEKLHTPRLDLLIKNPGETRLAGVLGLRKVVLAGGGLTTLSGVRSSGLNLTLKGHSTLQMTGEMRVASLNLDNGAWLSMYWVKGDRLVLRGKGKTVFQMAGNVDVLDVELWDKARFKGRYMHAKETFVKTHGYSLAEISTWSNQHVLSTDASDIYYYQRPMTKADFMARNGAVLDMSEWHPDIRENLYTPVNNL